MLCKMIIMSRVSSSRGKLLYDVVWECCSTLEQFQNAWLKVIDSEFQKFETKTGILSEGFPEYLMALANDSMRSTEFSEA